MSTSVDETIVLPDGRQILVEIDSSNTAKLLAGQYALLNGLCKADRAQTLFLVVHYYIDKMNKDKPYTAHRSIKNFYAIQSFAPGPNWLPYKSINMDEMRKLIAESVDIADFADQIWPAQAALVSPTSLVKVSA